MRHATASDCHTLVVKCKHTNERKIKMSVIEIGAFTFLFLFLMSIIFE